MNQRNNLNKQRRMRVIRRRKARLRRRIICTVMIMFIIAMVPSFMNNIKAKTLYDVHYKVYTVQADDTIWDIAQNITNEKTDVRETIYNIEKLNNFDKGYSLKVGQTIKLPTY